uniref:Uncharacterized protein n=1 Tax=Porolithon onkodes TaxID=231751 RepID=A0A2Z2KSB4_9FLOR|nr:hypothetical protein [Porolithon onkodes]ASB29788.1 hypothetical protein [Porolithon onkodes]
MLNIDNNYSTLSLYKKHIVLSFIMVRDRKKYFPCKVNFYAPSSAKLSALMNEYSSLFSLVSLSHLLYIGKEIYKVEISTIFKQKYIQS